MSRACGIISGIYFELNNVIAINATIIDAGINMPVIIFIAGTPRLAKKLKNNTTNNNRTLRLMSNTLPVGSTTQTTIKHLSAHSCTLLSPVLSMRSPYFFYNFLADFYTWFFYRVIHDH
ncbi:hypothetical protein [Raoultella ornithinolytica]|uniref:hypothetical protein n=1 Tax=Raoultella ornithinolytica TaxID=54291 RepID=UPI0039B56E1F